MSEQVKMKELLQPLGDRVVVKPKEKLSEKSYGNIVIPDMGKERPEIVEVVGVGPGRLSEFGTFIKVEVNVGDTVLVPKIGPLKVELNGETYLIVQSKEILGIVSQIEQ